jgi:hypothetical protein
MDPDPTPDRTPCFCDFKDAKSYLSFSYLFSYNLPAGTLSLDLKIYFLAKAKILFCKLYFSPLNTFMRKGKDPDPNL